MLSTLSAWSYRCATTLSSLESQIASIKADAQRRHRDEQDWNAHVESLVEITPPVESNTDRLEKRNAALEDPASDEEMNDVDSAGGQQTKDTRSAKKRGFGGLGFGK
ncbi:hypothetical protein DID88_000537 [Monilinia fructigena]|uniref:Uncharacterized protein n=1 Tax=Monilinia fructigena TaxID=38457 RepID=A0A395II53_9HELO|nr:hypothetical protein DID88_000537 [Monilinia fructigena]